MNRTPNIFTRAFNFFLALLFLGGLGYGIWTLTDVAYNLYANPLSAQTARIQKLIDANKRTLDKPQKAFDESFGPKIILTDGPDIEAKTLKFSFLGVDYSVKPAIDKKVYYGAVNANRKITVRSDKPEQELNTLYYRAYVDDPLQEPLIDALCQELASIAAENQFTSDEYADFLAKFVQSIPYDHNRAALAFEDTVSKGDPRFPIQVLVDGTGDCDEKVLLLAALLKHEGYGVSALLFVDELHMSLGLASETGAGYKGTTYIYVETTSPCYISEPPEVLTSGTTLESNPTVLVLGEGTDFYSQAAVDEVSYLVNVRDTALKAADKKEKEIKSYSGSEKGYRKLIAQYEACFEAYNTLQETVNNKGATEDAFKDRVDAIKWAEKNCWWVSRD